MGIIVTMNYLLKERVFKNEGKSSYRLVCSSCYHPVLRGRIVRHTVASGGNDSLTETWKDEEE